MATVFDEPLLLLPTTGFETCLTDFVDLDAEPLLDEDELLEAVDFLDEDDLEDAVEAVLHAAVEDLPLLEAETTTLVFFPREDDLDENFDAVALPLLTCAVRLLLPSWRLAMASSTIASRPIMHSAASQAAPS